MHYELCIMNYSNLSSRRLDKLEFEGFVWYGFSQPAARGNRKLQSAGNYAIIPPTQEERS